MDSDLKAAGNPDLSPRAGIAMLTLQIRATAQEAGALEAQYTPIDHEAARQQLRDRLNPLIEERERAFVAELESVRVETERTLGAARREAADIVAERLARQEAERIAAEAAEAERLAAEAAEAERLEAERLEAEAAEAERLEEERLAAEAAEAERLEVERLAAEAAEAQRLEDERLEAERAAAERLEVARVALAANVLTETEVLDEPEAEYAPTSVFAPIVEAAEPTEVLQPSQVLSPQTPPAPAALPVLASSQAPINVTIDADAFARVFATVFASLIEHRLVDQPTQMYMRPMMEAPAPVQPKQGFWSHARHPDVLLMGLATIIVLVVLAAWLV